jgi:hypothetical protein
MRPVFILGAGRSGTTLLQRLLNSYPDTLIWGEHAGVLQHLAQGFYRGLEDPSLLRHARPLADVLADTGAREHWQAWMTWFSCDEWTATFRRMVESLFCPGGLPGKAYWGFKDIRYGNRPEDRTLEFLHTLFPDALFVFIVRDPLNVMASRRRMADGIRTFGALRDAAALWEARYRRYWAWHSVSDVQSFWVRYEELIQGRGDVIRLLETLGKTLGEEQQAVFASASGRGSSFGDDAVNERWRRLPTLWRAYLRASLGDVTQDLGYDAPRVTGVERWLVPVARGLRRLGRAPSPEPRLPPPQGAQPRDGMAPGGSDIASARPPRSRATMRLREKRATVRQ